MFPIVQWTNCSTQSRHKYNSNVKSKPERSGKQDAPKIFIRLKDCPYFTCYARSYQAELCLRPCNGGGGRFVESKSGILNLSRTGYVPNKQLHTDLGISPTLEETTNISHKYKNKLTAHPNELATPLFNDEVEPRRLKRFKPADLMKQHT
jgi:hypothetical protein